MRWMFGLALLAGTLGSSTAHAGEFRQLTLVDGRVLLTEIMSTEAEGLVVKGPQGTSVVIFELLLDMVPLDEGSFNAQDPWLVHVAAPGDIREDIVKSYSAMPNMKVVGQPGSEAVTADMVAALEACETDFACVKKVSQDMSMPWLWTVGVTSSGGEAPVYTFKGGVNYGDSASNSAESDGNISNTWLAARQAIGLDLETKIPKELKGDDDGGGTKKGGTGDVERSKVIGLSFAPVPGLPSIVQKDYAGLGIALGTALPATALWFGAVGKNAQSSGEHILLGVAGFYAATVAVNHIVGLRNFEPEASDMVVAVPAPTSETGSVLPKPAVE